jgi:AraC family transcriptional regulator of adaptative response/methylated-DNA-[protein]-cysteine methyltransferase
MPSDYTRIEHAIRYLDEHATEQPSLEQVAARVGLSEFHFQKLFSRWAGVSPKRFLQALTVAQAKRILDGTSAAPGGGVVKRHAVSLLETSHAVGLSGPGRLHDLFLRVEAMTPGEFKAGAEGLTIRWGVHATPFGDALFGVTARGLCHLAFVTPKVGTSAASVEELRDRWPGATVVRDPEAGAPYAEELTRRARGKPRRELGLLLKGTSFQLKVWQALLRVGPGALVTYAQLAGEAGAPGSARAVGTAVGQNPIGYLVPCHRVIRATGALGDYHWGEDRKRAIVALEQARRA